MTNRNVDDDNISTTQTTANSTSSNTSNSADNTESPGRRVKNPLGYFSSYTYQLSLYMITPDAYDAFVQSGRKQITALNNAQGNLGSGALLIAQSGGINNSTSIRAPGFNLDYYIDNLSLKTYTNPKSTLSETNTTEVKFQIIEPYGFSFISKLKLASDEIQKYTTTTTKNYLTQNPSRQFFVLGIRFLGYDENGNVMTGNEIYNGNAIDREATTQGIFDRYYDIFITGIKFKIDGNTTTYNIDAVSIAPHVAFGVKRGMISANTKIEAETVNDALSHLSENGLLSKLNKLENDLLNQSPAAIEYANTYEIEFIGDKADEIKDAKIVIPEDIQKYTWPGSQAQNTTQSTVATEADATPNNTKRQITFKNDTPVIQAIAQVISQSTYLRNALEIVYNNSTQPDTNGNGYDVGVPNTKKTIAWYNLSAVVSEAKWDGKRSDFVYKIKYVIQRYETPVIQSVYANKDFLYYGPHKRYEYWYTGQNSEILSYEQTLNNNYFNVALSELPLGREPGPNNSNPPVTPYRRSSSTTSTGSINAGKEAQNNYLTSLYDPGSFATAKITILGDPDFLAQDSPGSIEELYNKFYGDDGFTINPSGGQVFIEVDFKEAVDYDYDTGTLSINDRILFWEYPEKIKKIVKGVSYMVVSVNSNFSGGDFKQVLDCTINTFGDYKDESNEPRESTSPSTTRATTTTGTGLIENIVPQIGSVPPRSDTRIPFRVVTSENS